MTDPIISADTPTTPEMVRWAFRTILGHHFVPDEVVRAHQQTFPSFDALCEGLKDSDEFAFAYAARSSRLSSAMPDASEMALRTVIISLYRTYLRRDPDGVGMADNLALLRRMDGLAGVGPLASIFEQSSERAIRDHLPACLRWITSGNGQPEEFGDTPIVSLGSHCAPSMILKKNELKRFSAPFDWMFSTPAMVRHCFQDNFTTLLDSKYHRPVTRRNSDGRLEEVSQHTYYSERYSIVDPVFNHRNIVRPEILEYYNRCAARLNEILLRGQPVFFLQVVLAAHHSQEKCREEFHSTAALLKEMAPQSSLAMFRIHLGGGIMPDVRMIDEQGRHRLFQLDTVSTLGTLDFHEPIDQIGLMRALRWHARTPTRAGTGPIQ